MRRLFLVLMLVWGAGLMLPAGARSAPVPAPALTSAAAALCSPAAPGTPPCDMACCRPVAMRAVALPAPGVSRRAVPLSWPLPARRLRGFHWPPPRKPPRV
ncbi:hypothetical protein GALL_277770 [mine drainage metagenome]|uniref:Uncharacterized protein n=1 Tax=mine drainage metagenome TaxID=410659 RepID=A0A1J5RE94_9ZZZZ